MKKKLLIFKNGQNHKMAFLAVINVFLGAFSKIPKQNNNCFFNVFKAESEPKHEEKFLCVFFFKSQKHAFSGVKKK